MGTSQKQSYHMTHQFRSWVYIWKKKLIQKDTYTPTLTVALFIIARIWKQLMCPSVDEWIKQRGHICTIESEK